MTGGAAPKRKGDAWERAVLQYLRSRGFDVQRLYGAGRPDDVGDLILAKWGRLLVECKAVAASDRSGWLREAHDKIVRWEHSRLIPVIVEKRRRGRVEDAYVTLDLAGFCDLIDEVALRVAYLDEQDAPT